MDLAAFITGIKNGFKGDCPCCGRWAQAYNRQINHTIVRQMYILLNKGGDFDYVHTNELVIPGTTAMCDMSKAKYWALVVEKPNDDCPEKKTSGYWKLTERGLQFLRNQISIQKYARIYNDNVLSFEGKEVRVQDCLGYHFNYMELMAAK